MDFSGEDLLLDDKYAPITTRIGFFETDCESIATEFYNWRVEIDQSDDVFVSQMGTFGSLKEVLQSLCPLRTVGSNRYLFIPTKSSWTAYFANGYRGTDPSAIGYMAERCEITSIFAVARPHTLQRKGKRRCGRQGALIVEIYGPHQTEWLNLVREIRLYNDAGKWKFEQSGEPFHFEETEKYNKRRLKDRFTLQMFKHFLAEFGIHPFDEDYYLPDPEEQAVLIELSGNLPAVEKDISLEEARRLNGIED